MNACKCINLWACTSRLSPPADVHVVPVPSADTMAATAALDKELASAREPIPVRREHDSVSKGLTNAIDRAAPVRRGKLP